MVVADDAGLVAAVEAGLTEANRTEYDGEEMPLDLETKGKLKGKTLTLLQGYKQYVRAWVTFHPDATFYDFQNAGK